MKLAPKTRETINRFVGCLVSSLVLALMWGDQQGSSVDYGYGISQAVLRPRVFIFLLIGVGLFLLLTFRARVRASASLPGAPWLLVGTFGVVCSLYLLHWYDPAGKAKFADAADAASQLGARGLAPAYFSWLYVVSLVGVALVGALAIGFRRRALFVFAFAVSVAAAVVTWAAHHALVAGSSRIDHSLGASGCVASYLVIGLAMLLTTFSSNPGGSLTDQIERMLRWRPGFVVGVLGFAISVLALGSATWFSPNRINAPLVRIGSLFSGAGLSPVAVAYVSGAAWVLLAVAATATLVGACTRSRRIAVLGAVASGVGTAATGLTIYQMSAIGARRGADGATGPWQNLGTGGWLAALGFTLIAIAALEVLIAPDLPAGNGEPGSTPSGLGPLQRGRNLLRSPGGTGVLVILASSILLPPTLTGYWQQVLVSQIGVYVLLALGLNVVVGWAGLLDLGYIAFYAIGSYTTAYLAGSLPVKPPDFLILSPLAAIPVAIGVCLVAGVALGAPTLRLRGDYLAIVTLGFGEIIRIVAINNPGNFTNSTRGPVKPIPHPVIDLGPIHVEWGSNALAYWYLLLVFVLVVVVCFSRLENSRTGRAWAALREDEVAARASGVDTTRAKLLAFAIGASTSGLAGVFFASQVGYFNPDNFILNNSILVLAYVVFGGMGSIRGVILGAAVLTWLPEFLKDQVPANDRQMWIGAVLLGMMIFRPAGLFPEKRRKLELAGLDDSSSLEAPAVPLSEGL
jgi:ABC-type branched-subunit amino acid transport system permease subunit